VRLHENSASSGGKWVSLVDSSRQALPVAQDANSVNGALGGISHSPRVRDAEEPRPSKRQRVESPRLDRPVPPLSSEHSKSVIFAVDSLVDVRDSFGQWLEAQILKREDTRLFTHFLNWSAMWDEWLDQRVDAHRFAPFHTFSTGTGNHQCQVGTPVYVCSPCETVRGWRHGFVRSVHGLQVRVQYVREDRRVSYWFHVASEEIIIGTHWSVAFTNPCFTCVSVCVYVMYMLSCFRVNS